MVGTNDTVPLEKAPACVREAFDLIKERASAVNPDAKFNEILTAAYMEQQSMGVCDLVHCFILSRQSLTLTA